MPALLLISGDFERHELGAAVAARIVREGLVGELVGRRAAQARAGDVDGVGRRSVAGHRDQQGLEVVEIGLRDQLRVLGHVGGGIVPRKETIQEVPCFSTIALAPSLL